MERAETEWRLRQALELKERELESLRARSEGFDESKEGELQFSELKNSVEQQVSNIRQNLEVPEEQHGFGLDWKSRPSNDKIGNRRIERMGLDISNLKETLDLAFRKMQGAIFSSEAGPAEQQWRWAIEKDVTIWVIKGSVWDVQESFESGMADREEKENVALFNEVQRLKQENEEMKLQEIASGQLYLDLLRGFTDELCTRLLDFESEVQIRESVLCTVLNRRVIQNSSLTSEDLECNDAVEHYKTESCFREEIHRLIFEETFRSIFLTTDAGSNGNLQIEARAEDDISRPRTENDLYDQSVEVQNTPNSMRDELGKALEELASSVEQSLLEFSEVVSISQHNICNYIAKNNTRSFQHIQMSYYGQEILPLKEKITCSVRLCRLENMKHHLDLLSGQIGLLRKRESVYEKAFIRRCQNLQKAETEVMKEYDLVFTFQTLQLHYPHRNHLKQVDLLADQVELLLGLLKMVYMKLCQHSTVLEQYFEVSDC